MPSLPIAVRERQVRRDWNRLVRKERFRQLVGRDDPRVAAGKASLGRALDDVLAVLLAHKDQLRSAFTYYSMQGGLRSLQNGWMLSGAGATGK